MKTPFEWSDRESSWASSALALRTLAMISSAGVCHTEGRGFSFRWEPVGVREGGRVAEGPRRRRLSVSPLYQRPTRSTRA